MLFEYDNELDTFLTFDNDQELDFIYYKINLYYRQYNMSNFDRYQFNEELKLSKKRKIKTNNSDNISNYNINKKNKYSYYN